MARQQLVWLEAPGRFELRYPALVLSKLLPQLRQVCEPKQAQYFNASSTRCNGTALQQESFRAWLCRCKIHSN